MTKKVLVALGLVAAVILLGLYFFFSGGPPFKSLEKPKPPEVKTQAAPEPGEKPGEKPAPTPSAAPPTAPSPAPAPVPAPAPTPSPQAQPQLLTPQPIPPPEKPVTKPGAAPGAPKETGLPPLEPKEEYGLLAGSYRKYADAAKKMEQLKKQGQPAFIRKDKGMYQVWVGPFPAKKEAAAAAKALKGKRKSPPQIQKILIPVPK
jgi:cell division septation protein DedD